MAEKVGFFRGADGATTAAVFRSRLGWMGCLWRGERLRRTTFGHRSSAEARRALEADGALRPAPDAPAALRQLVARLVRFAGEFHDDFRDVPIDTSDLTPFQQRVLQACRTIPPGETRTYAQLAAAGGSAGAARAAGSVMARNRLPLIVPCHRVVGSGGSLGGFSAPQGTDMKRRLLDAEALAQSGAQPQRKSSSGRDKKVVNAG